MAFTGYDGLNTVRLSDYWCNPAETNDAVVKLEYLAKLFTNEAGVASLEQYKIYNKIILSIMRRNPKCAIPFQYEHVVRILATVKEIFKNESNVVECDPPARVIGDLHGSLDDLLYIYHQHNDRSKTGFVPAHIVHSFVFLANYVDYGDQSLEVLTLLFSMKIPSQTGSRKTILLRGNHETREINYTKGFRAELHRKFDKSQANDLFEKFNDVFNHMPLACVIGRRNLCVHDGISPRLTSLDAIRSIPKPLERVDKNVLACDLLWADFKEELKGFEPNPDRDISIRFGMDVLVLTLERLGLDCLFRRHQREKEGVAWNDCSEDDYPHIFTITSFSGKNKKNMIGLVNVASDGTPVPMTTLRSGT